MQRLKGKTAVVVGAGSIGPGWGNGKATAVSFAREGANRKHLIWQGSLRSILAVCLLSMVPTTWGRLICWQLSPKKLQSWSK